MAEISIQGLDVLGGVAPGLTAASAGGDHIAPDSGDSALILHVRNEDTASHTVTLDDVNSEQPIGAGSFDADVEITVPADEDRLVNLKQLNRFIDSNGQINMTYDAVTSLSVTAYRVR